MPRWGDGLGGEADTKQTQLHEIHASMCALDDVIQAPNSEHSVMRSDPATPVRPRRPGCVGPLRRAGESMAAKAVVQAIMAERGLDQQDRGLVRAMSKRVGMVLRYQRTMEWCRKSALTAWFSGN